MDLLEFYGINKNYISCLSECSGSDCFWETYNTIRVSESDYYIDLTKGEKDKIDLQTIIYLAYYSINDFYAQLFGLIALFTDATIVDLLTKIINWLIEKIQNKYRIKYGRYKGKYLKYINKLHKLIYSKIRLIIISFSLIFVLVQSGIMINDFRSKSTYPNKTTSLTYSSEPFSIVLCFFNEEYDENDNILDIQDSEIVKSNNFNEIELMTESMIEDNFNFIEINYGYNKINFNWTVSTKVIFKNSIFSYLNFLSRCYRIEFEIKEELKYKIILPFLTLKLEFNNKYQQIYLIEKNQTFTSNLVDFQGSFLIRKRSMINSKASKKSNCVDYSEKTNLKCLNRRHCIDRCINKKFYAKYNSLTIYSVIDKEELEYNLTQIKFNGTKDSKIESDCINTFNQPDCNDVLFEESFKFTYKLNDYQFYIKLNYENLEEKKLEQSLFKLFLDLMNLLSIFFGLNAIGILLIALSNLKRFFKLKWQKILKILIIIACSIMFLLNNIMIFHSIIKSDLIKNEHFKKLDK